MSADPEDTISEDIFHCVEEAESCVIRNGVAYWQSLCGGRKFPDRAQVTLRGLGRLTKNAVIVKVIEGGEDYEFRFVGHEPDAAIGFNFQGRLMSEPDVASVMQANYRRRLYDRVVQSRQPWLFKRRLMKHDKLNLPVCSETVYLPLGPSNDTVDHLLGFTVFSSTDRI